MKKQGDKFLDEKIYMKRAIQLAKQGEGMVNPNPLVGAVIVKNGEIIGEGLHESYGGFHAEVNAIKNCKKPIEGATLYVTLEPCCHHGKTPPCTEMITKSKIKRVVIGSKDPNPLVSGKGISVLRKNGIEVLKSELKEECNKLNEVFFHYIKNKLPYVVMKYAMTIDGKICTSIGESKWITGEEARKNVHLDRNKYMGIMVGIGTVISDNPKLDCRIEKGRNPIKIICDTRLRIPLNSNVIKDAKSNEIIIATCCKDLSKISIYEDRGCKFIIQKGNRINLSELMKTLGKMGVDSILLEGGSELNFSAISENIVDKVQVYISPKIFGGKLSKSPIGGEGIKKIQDSIKLKNIEINKIGEDILLQGEVIKCLQE